jgi:hypothetical protein
MLVVAEREQLPVTEARAGNVEAWESLFRYVPTARHEFMSRN